MSLAWVGWLGVFVHASVRRVWDATNRFLHSGAGHVLLQIPLFPLLLVRSPRVLALDVGILHGVAPSLFTAATLWFTWRQRV